MLARFHQASAGVGEADLLAGLDKHPSARDREHDELRSPAIQRRQVQG
jgi:hypothetical protein